jgi:DNA-binding transcriptional MerR regulator
MPATEYTIDQLARTADTTVRSVRVYHERGLLPPPEVRGRIGYYSHGHLNRLRTIHRLLNRGVTLNGIRELLAAWDRGEGLADVLGVAGDAADYRPSMYNQPDADALHTLDRTGSPRVRDLAARLVQGGMSLDDAVDALAKLRADCERMAIDHAEMFEAMSAGACDQAGNGPAQAISDLVAEWLHQAASLRRLP